ncbi:MAG: serine hydrolase domain-containing protein [Actinomycetota bacterium]|nr:serine hydrolase domain-containing protein [Actinomycetota bacterium]
MNGADVPPGTADAAADVAALGFDPDGLAAIRRHVVERYVDPGLLAGVGVLVGRHGALAHVDAIGLADVAAGTPMARDTIHRIYSMTKPITTVGVLTLVEEGRVALDDPVGDHLPELAGVEVFVGGDHREYTTRPPVRPPTVRDLLTHTGGLSYGFGEDHPVDDLYRRRRIEAPGGRRDLAELVSAVGELPLVSDPGTRWRYSISTDVLGRLCEVVAGQPLDRFLAERVTGPLGMVDTGFSVGDGQVGRLGACYGWTPFDPLMLVDPAGADSEWASPPRLLSGGAGMVSTLDDVHRFASMVLGGGELDGARVLTAETVAAMGRNQLADDADLAAAGAADGGETDVAGRGFGLGFSVLLDPARAGGRGSAGELTWGGSATTALWIDPATGLDVIVCAQLLADGPHPVREEVRALVLDALTA